MYLHDDEALFREVVYSTAVQMKLPVAIVEKDYYVTMILKKLSESSCECVFKGGTSLSKCHHVIERFSEDIDIAFSNKLTQGQRRNLKNQTIANISHELRLPIIDWENARSRRDYNCYTFSYKPLEGFVPESLVQGVKMEVALGSISFPTVKLPVDSYVYQFLVKDNIDVVEEFELFPFEMRIQSLERTLVDKVFALCDYYLTGKIKRHSRHLYDIYMLLPKVAQNEELKQLVQEVRKIRAEMENCPSAKSEINIPLLLKEIIDNNVYRDDYELITTYFQNKPLTYEKACMSIYEIIKSNIFE